MPKSYEKLVKRVQKEIGTVENVIMIPLDDAAEHIRLRWNPEESMS
ncbi:hypothetical protein [Vreelandella alkaliphila]|uniref:Uncharacterized protein n=1 Tax=Vreelandella alkaliphila TaxID=272774 RepID=A0A7C9P646_9GAMM|nr:hypothetical protein [Halomonas alkaliphila]NDL70494.1 hypothetical protein [Halomonas alkaliphila]